MRLDKFIADCGRGTRSQIREMIKKGRVSADGETLKDPSFKVKKDTKVCLDGKELTYSEFFYLMMNKPSGVISAVCDKKYKTVTDLLSPEYKSRSPFPVGRLDIDTEGLLIITNDGDFAHRITSPSHRVDKTYFVKTDSIIPKEAASLFSEGVYIQGGYKTLPAAFKATAPNEAYLTIHEGKFHQVKLMFEAVGTKVTYLKRIKIGNLCLDPDLLPGEYRPFLPSESVF